MKSKYNSTCKKCRKRIRIGDEITKENETWVHDICPSGNSILDAVAKAESDSLVGRNAIPSVEDTSTFFVELEDFTPSAYQQAVFDFIENGVGNAVVSATAGSGKTTTIVKALRLVPSNKKVLFLAFNRSIVAELRKRAPSNVVVSTIHALGLSFIRRSNPRVKIDEEKLYVFMDRFWPVDKSIATPIRIANRVRRPLAKKLVSLVKSTLVNYDDPEAIHEMLDHYSFDMNGDEAEVLAHLSELMEFSKDFEVVDFDDMPWLPVVLSDKIKAETYDYIFVDEAQDLNNCNAKFLLQLVGKEGRVIAVGDPRQSLYAFRGADAYAIPNLISSLNAKVLPLSISYRCPISHVQAIKGLAPEMEYFPGAKQGSISTMKYNDFLDKVLPGDMVLCRTNAPLMQPAYECIRKGKKAIIKGKDIGRALVTFIEKFETSILSELDMLMTEHTEREYRRLMDKGKDLQADNLMDRLFTIRSVSGHCKDVEDLKSKLLILFDDSNEGILFSSIHRAKGLEANTVYILRRDLMPHPKAKHDWEVMQEKNTMFVAGTRSKDSLVYVDNL